MGETDPVPSTGEFTGFHHYNSRIRILLDKILANGAVRRMLSIVWDEFSTLICWGLTSIMKECFGEILNKELVVKKM